MNEKVESENIRMFEIKYLGATNTLGSRIRISDLRFKKSVIIDRNYESNSAYIDAEQYLNKIGIRIDFFGEGIETDFLMSRNFETALIKEVKK